MNLKKEVMKDKNEYLYCKSSLQGFFTKGKKYLILKKSNISGIVKIVLKDNFGATHTVTNKKVVGWLKTFSKIEVKPKVKTISHPNLLKHMPGWKIKTGKAQVYGSCADIYLEFKRRSGSKYFCIIDDGNVRITGALWHIYYGDIDSKIFEGRLKTGSEVKVLMKILGFTK